jgi:two-component system KDP operon response regulator KdpE
LDGDGRIAVVEDDEGMAQALVAGLVARGYEVERFSAGLAAIRACNVEPPDVMLLDLGLPDLDGLEVVRQLRRWTQMPIIVLTADGAEDRKVLALEEGADDYVTKPFSMPELNARVGVALRHRRLMAPLLDGAVIQIGTVRMDTAGHLAWLDERPIDLTRLQFALLALFCRNCGKVLTYRHLLEHAWQREDSGTVASVRSQVFELRRKLGAGAGVPRIVNEPGTGYRMLQPE